MRQRTWKGAGKVEKAVRALARGWWRRESAGPSGWSGPLLIPRRPETEIESRALVSILLTRAD